MKYYFPAETESKAHQPEKTVNCAGAIVAFRAATGQTLRYSVDSLRASFGADFGVRISYHDLGAWIRAYYSRREAASRSTNC